MLIRCNFEFDLKPFEQSTAATFRKIIINRDYHAPSSGRIFGFNIIRDWEIKNTYP